MSDHCIPVLLTSSPTLHPGAGSIKGTMGFRYARVLGSSLNENPTYPQITINIVSAFFKKKQKKQKLDGIQKSNGGGLSLRVTNS